MLEESLYKKANIDISMNTTKNYLTARTSNIDVN